MTSRSERASKAKGRRAETEGVVFLTTLGWAGAAASAEGITRIVLPRASKLSVVRELRRASAAAPAACPVSAAVRRDLLRAVKLLRNYFAGRRVSTALRLDLGAATVFQRRVWRAAQAVPHGTTRSYAWIARKIGMPGAARAVGQAMGANPVPVLVP